MNKISTNFIHRFQWTRHFLIILAAFSCTFFIYRDFGIRMLYGFLVLGFIILLHLLHRFVMGDIPEMTNFKTMAGTLCIIIFACFLMPHSNKNVDNITFIISMFVCISMLILFDGDGEKNLVSVKILAVAGICMTVFVLFFVAFEDLFWVTLGPLLSDTAQEYLRYYTPRGYSITLGGSTFTDYIILFGMSAISGYLLHKNTNRTKMLVGWAVFLLSFMAIVCVGRKGEVVSVVATFIVLILVSGNPKQRKRKFFTIAAACAVIFIGLILLLPVLRNVDFLVRYVHMFDKMFSGQDITSGRLDLYKWALDLFLENPVFGIGWGQFANYIPYDWYMLHSGGGIQVVRDVHCIYLQFLCESGIVGTIFIMIPLVYCYMQTLKQILRLQDREAKNAAGTVCLILNHTSFCIQTFLGIIGIIDPCFERVNFWCFYGMALMMQHSALSIEKYVPASKFDEAVAKITALIQKGISKVFTGFKKQL